jgi:predicted alpha/beta-hydrolase family hydrolase
MILYTVDLPNAQIPVELSKSGPNVAILAHGAGSHMGHRTMVWLSGLVEQAGFSAARFDFAYRVSGKSIPDRMPVLMETYRAVIADIRKNVSPKRLIIGGHSMGGRVASMLAAEAELVDGLLLFAYPLHPPGRFDKLRDEHLPRIMVTTLQLSGTRDDFCRKDLMEAVPVNANYKLVWLEGADHSYAVSKASGNSKKDVEAEITREIASAWPPSASG